MKKVIFNKSFIFSIIVAVMSALLIACFFIPVIGPSERYRDTNMAGYSCKDIIVAINANTPEEAANLSASEEKAWFEVNSPAEDGAKMVKVIGIVGLVNAMIGAIMLVVSILSIFYRSAFVSSGLLALYIIGVLASVAIIILMCIYLKMPSGTSGTYSYWYSVSASAFVMLGATLIGGTCSCFIKQ